MNNMVIPLQARNELAGGARIGGRRDGGVNGQLATVALWKGRPPRLESGLGPNGFMISTEVTDPQLPGGMVLIELEAGNAWGGVHRRQFHVGAGITADLRLGNFEHIVVKAVFDPARNAPGIPAGVSVSFDWTWELVGRGDLLLFQSIPAASSLQAPQGAEFLTPELPCTVTWQVPAFGTTFTQSLIGGQEVRAAFPTAFTCNVPNKFIWRLRGI